jgi:hypothetical protein
MRKRITVALLIGIVLAISQSSAALAHQPRLVCEDKIVVENPEVSKAYYDTLNGSPRTYIIESHTPFLLYLNLLVPKSSNPQGRYSAIVYRIDESNRVEWARLEASSVEWKEFYEEYGGDYYLWGPEYEKTVPVGQYEIVVFGNGNLGKYVLAIGKAEEFPPTEIAKAFYVIPVLKTQFFKYSPQTLLSNRIVIAWLIIIIILLLAVVLIPTLIHRQHSKQSKDSYSKIRQD